MQYVSTWGVDDELEKDIAAAQVCGMRGETGRGELSGITI